MKMGKTPNKGGMKKGQMGPKKAGFSASVGKKMSSGAKSMTGTCK